VVRIDIDDILIGMMLEKLMACGGATQAAEHAELAVMNIGDAGAVVLACGIWIDLGNGSEEKAGEFSIDLRALRHNFFRNLTAILTS